MKSPLLQSVQLGVKSLVLQKMRAGLAALGIFIGTTTVIWLVAVGEGVSHRAQQQILELGATNVIVRSKEPNDALERDSNSRVKTYGLLRNDYRRIVFFTPGLGFEWTLAPKSSFLTTFGASLVRIPPGLLRDCTFH